MGLTRPIKPYYVLQKFVEGDDIDNDGRYVKPHIAYYSAEGFDKHIWTDDPREALLFDELRAVSRVREAFDDEKTEVRVLMTFKDREEFGMNEEGENSYESYGSKGPSETDRCSGD